MEVGGDGMPVRDAEMDALFAEMRRYAEERRVPILQKESADLLCMLVRIARPARILEVGTAIGYSALRMLEAAGDGAHVLTVEQDYDMVRTARQFFARSGLDGQVKVIGGDALEVLPQLCGPYDFVFLDANKAHYCDFLPHVTRVLRAGGVLVCDNVLFRGMVEQGGVVRRRKITIVKRMRRFLQELEQTDQFETCVLRVGDGVSVSYKK